MNLTNYEKKLLIALAELKKAKEEELVKKTGMPLASVSRAAAWLEEKGLVKTSVKKKEKIMLGSEGLEYYNNGLPERRILEAVKGKEKSIKELVKELGEETVKIGTVWLRKLNAARIEKGKLILTEEGEKFLEKPTPHEELLRIIKEGKPVPERLKPFLEELKKRGKTLVIEEEKEKTVMITEEGLKKSTGIEIVEEITTITPEIIRTREWEKKRIREYDVKAPVPVVNPGKKQAYYAFIDDLREKMIALGFKEMRGNIVQTEFWNFDVLFQPQTHPARSERDTYYLEKPSKGELFEKDLVEKVRKAHEKGIEGSKGWGYEWSEEKAKNLILRSHTTCLSAKTLFAEKQYPLRYFSIGRNFRRDVIDASHLPEFNQLEGIVADESLNLRDLLGLLKTFAEEIAGAERVRFKTGYFPYTEPSVEAFAKHPQLGWIELGGAGLFRPEMLEPLGVKMPVIAWGLGVDRLAMFKLGLKHIKDLFSQDLKTLRETVMRW